LPKLTYHITNPQPPQIPAGYIIQQSVEREKVGDKERNNDYNPVIGRHEINQF
jgi:hypothetical protein